MTPPLLYTITLILAIIALTIYILDHVNIG